MILAKGCHTPPLSNLADGHPSNERSNLGDQYFEIIKALYRFALLEETGRCNLYCPTISNGLSQFIDLTPALVKR